MLLLMENDFIVLSLMMSKWEEYKKKNGVTPLDLLNPRTQHTTDEEAKARLDICKECPFFIKATTQCTKCGCFMFAKTKLKSAKCPEGKW